jgi:hypothetical protein
VESDEFALEVEEDKKHFMTGGEENTAYNTHTEGPLIAAACKFLGHAQEAVG